MPVSSDFPLLEIYGYSGANKSTQFPIAKAKKPINVENISYGDNACNS